MGWTTKKPEKPGWYWYRGEPDLNETMMWISTDGFALGIGFNSRVELLHGQWSSEPVTPPTNDEKISRF